MPSCRQQSVKGTRVMAKYPFIQPKNTQAKEERAGKPKASREIPWKILGKAKGEIPGKTPDIPEEIPRNVGSPLASLQTAADVVKAGCALMPASPRRPLEDQWGGLRGRKQEASQQPTSFGGRERPQPAWLEITDRWSRWPHSRAGKRAGHDDQAGQKSQSQHDEGDIAIPASETADFIVIQSQIFAILAHLLRCASARPRL